ncbi:uncharacterized protein [Ptychodera flava]|uniref:uncharacterized protein n=1 Tax=Ptychodera flava TaxID=63121 RepID=UPI00396A300C
MDKVTIYDNLPKDKNVDHRVIASTLVKMAYTQFLLGCLLIYAGAAAVYNECHFAYLGIPIYGGMLAMLTGLLTLISTERKTTDVTAATIIFSFMSATFCAVVVVTVMAVALGSEEYVARVVSSCDRMDYMHQKSCKQQLYNTTHKRQTIDTFILLMAVCEAIVAIINGILCSRVLCRNGCKKCCSQTSQIQCCWRCTRNTTPYYGPTQMKAYLGPQRGSVEVSQDGFMSMPVGEGNNMFIMIPANSAKVNGKDSKDIERQREVIDTAISESSPLLK